MADNLFAVLAAIRREIPEVQDAAWDRLLHLLSDCAGGTRPYVPSQPKRARLEALAGCDDTASAEELARRLGVSVRRVNQLRQLMRR